MSHLYSLDRQAFETLAAQHGGHDGTAGVSYALVSRQIPADLETPVSALLKIRRGEHCFLLESVERGSQVGRYSFLGTGPSATFTVKDGITRTVVLSTGEESEAPAVDPLGQLDTLIASRRLIVPEGTQLPRFAGGAVGYAGYETACTLEPVRPAANDVLGLPDLAFAIYDTFLVFDHAQRSARVYTLVPLSGDANAEYASAVERIEQIVRRLRQPLAETSAHNGHKRVHKVPHQSNMAQEDYEGMVERAREHIAAGDIIQAVVSQRFDRPTSADPFSIYRALRMVNPSPYMFFLQFGDTYLVGASPEMLVQVQDGKVATRPIAGTKPRGADAQEDKRLEKELAADEKERAEHVMLVDLGRNDIGRISRIGSVKVPRFMEVEHYSHVMHLVSEVTGDLRPEYGAMSALRSCLPAGTLSGAPKVRAMQIISELEHDRRGPYGGAAGYISYNGNLDTAIIIRTIIVKDGMAHLQAGAGIVADSVPETEYHESLAKAKVLMAAIDLAEEMESEHTALEYATQDELEAKGAII